MRWPENTISFQALVVNLSVHPGIPSPNACVDDWNRGFLFCGFTHHNPAPQLKIEE